MFCPGNESKNVAKGQCHWRQIPTNFFTEQFTVAAFFVTLKIIIDYDYDIITTIVIKILKMSL